MGSTKNLVKNHKNKKKAYTFSERCSIFKSDYTVGHKSNHQSLDTSISTKKIKSLRQKNPALMAGIKAGPQQQLFNRIIKEIDMETMKEQWNELITYWDSWESNQGRIVPANELRFSWDDYKEDIVTVSKDIDKLVERLSPFNSKYVKNLSNKTDSARIDALKKVSSK